MWEITHAGKKSWSGDVVIQLDITKIQNYGQDIEYDTHEAEQKSETFTRSSYAKL